MDCHPNNTQNTLTEQHKDNHPPVITKAGGDNFIGWAGYDTLILRLDGVEKDCIDDLAEKYYFTKKGIDNTRGHFADLLINNLIVNVSELNVWIKGSVPKFLHGNNVRLGTNDEIPLFIATLNRILGIDVSCAMVFRMDIALSIVTNSLPNTYFPFLAIHPRLKRDTELNGIYFKGNLKKLSFYNKCKEPGVVIPNEANGYKIMRYEVRFNNEQRKKTKWFYLWKYKPKRKY